MNPALQAVALAAGALFIALSAAVLVRLRHRLRTAGGQVDASRFGVADLLCSFVLATTFGGLVAAAVLRHAEAAEMKPEQVLPESLSIAVIVAGVVAFIAFRGLRPISLLGLGRLAPHKILGWALLLLLAAFPIVAVVNGLTALVLKDDAVQQPLVELFRTAARRGNHTAMASIFTAAIIIAPCCEEFLFRGYFYGVGKRFLGPWISAFGTALLFAAFHANLASLPGLFVLALALTAAYERTGSLFVPMTMHALFNATSLSVLYVQAVSGPPS